MSIAICTIAYNEADKISKHIKNWKGLIDKHLVLLSSLPWNGSPSEYDGTGEIAKQEGAEVITRFWSNEDEQRNWGLAYLYNYDYVLKIDTDDIFTEEDQDKILKRLNDPYDYINKSNKKIPAFCSNRMITYWKNEDYIFDPPDKHRPIIAVDPKQVRFSDKRSISKFHDKTNIETIEPIDVSIHHYSWIGTDDKIKEKIEHYSHNKDIALNWFDDVWMKWTPESDMIIKPYGADKSKALLKR